MPAILRFLGYSPLPPGSTWAKRLVSGRKGVGITQKEAARRLGVDQSTLARWEGVEQEPVGEFAFRAERLVAPPVPAAPPKSG